MASRSSAAAHHSPHQQQRSSTTTTTAPVLEYLCLFTHDLKRKQKRWQDGKLRYHAFNGKAVVHDERGNLVGDAHAHDPPREGDEMQLERGGGVLVQVASEVVGVQQQDLSAVVDRRVAEREERARAKITAAAAAAAAARSGVGRMGRPATGPVVVHTPVRSSEADHMRHRPLASVIGTPTGHHGRALVPSESPFEQRHHHQQQQQQISMNHTAGEAVTPASVAQPAAKRRRYEDSPPSKAGYAQNLFGAKLNLSSQPTSSLQSLRAAASQRRIAERAARVEHEEERDLEKRPAARDFGRPALGASRSQEIVVSDDEEEEDAAPAKEVSRPEARLPAARPNVRPVVHATPRRSAVGQMVRQSIDAAMQQRSHESNTSPGQSMQGERRKPTTSRQESQRPRAPDPIPPESEIIDIDADDEPAPQLSVPAWHVPVAQQSKRNQLLSRATNRGNVSIGDVKNMSRTAKDAAPISVEPNVGEDGRQAAQAPARDEPRTELRIKSRKKRGLLMVTEKIAPPKPASDKPKARPAERESSETLDAEKSDPFASSPPGRTGEFGLDSAPGCGNRNNKTAESTGNLAQEVSNYDQEGLDFLFDNDDTHLPVADEPVASRVLKDCTNTIQSRSTDVQEKRKPTPELPKQSSRLEEVTTAPTELIASQEAGLKEKGAEPVEAEALSEDESDNVQIVRKRTKSNTEKTRKEATSPVVPVPDASDDDNEPIVPTTTKRLTQRASRNARAASASVDPSSDEEPVVAKKTKRLVRNDTRKTESTETSLDPSSDEEIRPRQRPKRTAQRRRKEEPVVMSLEEDYSDQAPRAKAKSKRRLRSKSRDDEELAALRDDDDDDEASEDMPAPPPKKRARKRAKDKGEQDEESATSAREAKPAPRLARLSKKSVKSRELIGFNFDEPKGPMTSLIGAAKTVVSVQSRNASDTSVENNREGSDSRAQLGNDRMSSAMPVEPAAPPSPPSMKSAKPVAVDVIKPVEEEPVAVRESGCKQVFESAPATAAPIAIKETMAIASKIIDAWESQHGKATSTTLVQEPARTVNGLVLDSASASEASIAKHTEQTNKANESAVQGTTEAVPTVPSLPQGDSSLSTKSAPAETTAAELDKTDEIPCEPRDRPQPQPPGRLFRRQASVGMPPPAAAGSGAPRIANPASRGRKAALKSDAAGQVPQSILSASTLYGGAGGVGGSMMAMMQMQMQMMNAQGGPAASAAATAEALEPPPPKKVKKMTFPGFQPAGGSGPWSREAFDLLEMGRPL